MNCSLIFREDFPLSKPILPVTPKHAMSKLPSYRVDIPIIAVLGAAGAGKSYFIRKATANADVKIGHSLESGKSDLR
jgi:hypothetical protein